MFLLFLLIFVHTLCETPQLGNNNGKEEPDGSGILSEILLPTILLIVLMSIGTGVACLRLAKKINALQSQLELSVEKVKVLINEKASIKKKEISLQEKLCGDAVTYLACCSLLKSKLEELTAEMDLVTREKAYCDHLQSQRESLFRISDEQNKMIEILMQNLCAKKQESDAFQKQLTDYKSRYWTIEVELANALKKIAQLGAAETECSQLNKKCYLQVTAQSFENEKLKVESSPSDEKLKNNLSLKAPLNKLQSIRGYVPTGQMDALLHAEKIRTKINIATEERNALTECEKLTITMNQSQECYLATEENNRRLELRNQELHRECADLRKNLNEMASQMRHANYNVPDFLLSFTYFHLLPYFGPTLAPPFNLIHCDKQRTSNSMRALLPQSHLACQQAEASPSSRQNIILH